MRDHTDLPSAPFHSDVADAPPDAEAWWVDAEDGVPLRVARLGSGPRGDVLLLAGRAEYLEKYGPTGRALAERGYGTLSLDWRGQGLSGGRAADRFLGHVDSFDAYQLDLRALINALPVLGRTEDKPLKLLAHSMGAAIGLRAMRQGLEVSAAVFSAPLWGIALGPLLGPIAPTVLGLARKAGLSQRYAPGTRPASYVLQTAFAKNVLTGDAETWAWLQHQQRTYPDLRLGGPSIAWVHAALMDIAALHRGALPAVPSLIAVGTEERVVDARALTRLAARWPDAEIWVAKQARHEILLERPELRDELLERTCALFDRV